MASVGIAIVVEAGDWPAKAKLTKLARRAVDAAGEAIGKEGPRIPSPQGGGEQELSIVFTNDAAMREINKAWRGKDSPTNVLSFPQAPPPHPPLSQAKGAPSPARGEGGRGALQPAASLLGDVILSAETVAREAALASKPLEDHMAHLIIHGFLHLLGYDHESGRQAEKMEQLERVALKKLGISDPYAAPRGQ